MTRIHLWKIKNKTERHLQANVFLSIFTNLRCFKIYYQDRSSTELPSLLMSLKSLFSTFEVYYYFLTTNALLKKNIQ